MNNQPLNSTPNPTSNWHPRCRHYPTWSLHLLTPYSQRLSRPPVWSKQTAFNLWTSLLEACCAVTTSAITGRWSDTGKFYLHCLSARAIKSGTWAVAKHRASKNFCLSIIDPNQFPLLLFSIHHPFAFGHASFHHLTIYSYTDSLNGSSWS